MSEPVDPRLIVSSAPAGRDRVLKALTGDRQAVVIAIDARQVLTESLNRIKAWPPSMIHLGQAMMATALVQALPDHAHDEQLDLQWRSNGPFGHLFAECRGRAGLRGTILNPRADVKDLKQNLGSGLLQVRRKQTSVYTGIIEARGDIILDLLEYLEKSEQKNCAMNLWVDVAISDAPNAAELAQPFVVRNAIGYLIQVLPQKTKAEEDAILLNWDRHLRSLGTLSSWILGADPAFDVLSFVTAEFKPNIIYDETPIFSCSCSVERAENALALSEKLANEPLALAGDQTGAAPIDVECEFCGKIYQVEPPAHE